MSRICGLGSGLSLVWQVGHGFLISVTVVAITVYSAVSDIGTFYMQRNNFISFVNFTCVSLTVKSIVKTQE